MQLLRLLRLIPFVVGITLIVAPRANAATFPSGYFGTHGNAVPSALNALAANGVGVERSDASWAVAEPSSPVAGHHSYDWSALDYQVRILAQSGLRYYPVFDYSPVWARVDPGDPASPPADISSYAAFVAAFATRYGEHGTFWAANPSLPYLPVLQYEIWNEPNSPTFWNPPGAPSAYFTLYAAARKALHAVQPSGVAVMAGISDSSFRERDAVAWLQQLETEVPGALREVDAVGLHPYLYYATSIEARVVVLRDLLRRSGAAVVPIEITEFGALPEDISQSEWASNLTVAVRDLATSTCGVTRIIPYRDQDPNAGVGALDSFGYYVMYDRQGIPTPVASAYFTGIAQARAAKKANPLCGRAKLRLRVAKRRLGKVLSGGLVIRVISNQPGKGSVRLVLAGRTAKRLGLSRRAKPAVIGRASTVFTKSGSQKVVLKLTRKARARLTRKRPAKLVLKLKAMAVNPAGIVTRQRKVTRVRR